MGIGYLLGFKWTGVIGLFPFTLSLNGVIENLVCQSGEMKG